jgi:glycosyltransferase involved in cell wall biosynthesis
MPPAPDTPSCSAHLPAILHLSSAAGGGADRYVRDLARDSARQHYLWHTGAGLDVIEDLAARRFFPLAETVSLAAGDALARFARSARLGLLHLHAVDAASRARITRLVSLTGLPFVATLHDLGFLDERAFDADGMPAPDPGWTRAVATVLGAAATVIAPSEFIAAAASAQLPGVSPVVIAPGIETAVASATPPGATALPPAYKAHAPAYAIAVIGAIGPHKGSGLLAPIAEALAGSNVGIVVIGYTDAQRTPGWSIPGRLWIHGAYEHTLLPAWLAAYRVRAVLFPNRLPESFSYTLSEAWAAGVPAIVPQDGALGERVARHGGGFVLPAGFAAVDAARLLLRLFSAAGTDERLRVQSQLQRPDPDRVPTLEAMNRAVDLLYARFAAPAPATPGAADPAAGTGAAQSADPTAALAPMLAANLDGFTFRPELMRLAGELAAAREMLSAREFELANVRADLAAAKLWAEKSAGDIAEIRAWAAKLEADVGTLNGALARAQESEALFLRLPEPVRNLMLKRARRGRG